MEIKAIAPDLLFKSLEDEKKNEVYNNTINDQPIIHSGETIHFIPRVDIKIVNDLGGMELILPVGTSLKKEETVESRIEKNVITARSNYWQLQAKLSNRLCLEAAFIAKHVYTGNGTLIGGWRISSDFYDLRERYNMCDDNGLVSNLYSRKSKEKKEYIYATAGTNIKNPFDHIANITQIFGCSDQYDAALELAVELDDRVKQKGGCLYFVGHSLGGGEASLNALYTHNHAFVFNPAGVSVATKNKYKIISNVYDEFLLIDSFIMTHDILNVFQDIVEKNDEFPHAIGHRWYIEPHFSAFPNHGMSQMLDELRKVAGI